jgi:low affinity Fe/Cu permease
MGTPTAFIVATLSIVVWAITGPLFHFSDTWQLVINTGTTVLTFLMVFLVQNTQNRDAKAMHVKLDALVLANERISNALIAVEEQPDDTLQALSEKVKDDA